MTSLDVSRIFLPEARNPRAPVARRGNVDACDPGPKKLRMREEKTPMEAGEIARQLVETGRVGRANIRPSVATWSHLMIR